MKICSKYTGEHPCRGAISINLLCNFIEIAFRHGCFPVNLLHIFKKTFFIVTLIKGCFCLLQISRHIYEYGGMGTNFVKHGNEEYEKV